MAEADCPKRGEGPGKKWRRLSQLAAVVIGAGGVITLAGFVLISFVAPTVSTYGFKEDRP